MYKVLIVDDEVLIREGIANEIDWLKLDCEIPNCAQNGIEAINIIKSTHIDFIITDIKMPGMNGLELAEWIHVNFGYINIIILTGYSDFEFAQTAIKYGVVDFILKPTKIDEIEATIEKIKKKLKMAEVEHKKLEIAKMIIDKNKNLEVLKLINGIIFGNTENLQKIKTKFVKLNFNPYMYKLLLLDMKRLSESFIEIDEKVTYYTKYIENRICNIIETFQIQILSNLKNGYLIFYIYSQDKNIDKTNFNENTTKIISCIEDDFNAFFHYIGNSLRNWLWITFQIKIR